MAARDPGRVGARQAVRVAVVVPLAAWLCLAVLGLGAGAGFAGLAAFSLTAFADFTGGVRERTGAYLLTGGAGTAAMMLGFLCGRNPVAAVVGSFVLAFVLFLVGAIRAVFAAAAIPVIIPFFVAAVSGPVEIVVAAEGTVGWALGSVLATAAALLIWPPGLEPGLQRGLVGACAAVARMIRELYGGGGSTTPVDLNTRMREVVKADAEMASLVGSLPTRPGSATARDRAVIELTHDIGQLQTLLRWQARRDVDDFSPDADLARTCAHALSECAESLAGGTDAPDPRIIDAARALHRRRVTDWTDESIGKLPADQVSGRLAASFEVRTISAATERVCAAISGVAPTRSTGRAGSPWHAIAGVASAPRPLRLLRQQLRPASPCMRNALRTAAAVALATLVANWVGVSQAFWVVLGALTALRFSVIGTGRTARQMLLGALLGCAAAVTAVGVVGDNAAVYWILLPVVVAAAAYLPVAGSKLLGQATFVLALLVLLGPLAGSEPAVGPVRVVDVALGVGVSLAMGPLLWPRGLNESAFAAARQAIRDSAECMVAAFDDLTAGDSRTDVAEARRSAASAALVRARVAFDLAQVAAGPRPLDERAWFILTSNAAQIVAGSRMLMDSRSTGLANLPCPAVADAFQSAAHQAHARFCAAADCLASLDRDRVRIVDGVGDTSQLAPGIGVAGDAIVRLRATTTDCVGSLPAPVSRDLGTSIETMLWAQEWLIHFDWLSRRTQRVQPIRSAPKSG